MLVGLLCTWTISLRDDDHDDAVDDDNEYVLSTYQIWIFVNEILLGEAPIYIATMTGGISINRRPKQNNLTASVYP